MGAVQCRGLCMSQYAIVGTRSGRGGHPYAYSTGIKRCTCCSVWIRWDGLRCPCCSHLLRTGSRNARNRPREARRVA